jgi:hypothetical protein
MKNTPGPWVIDWNVSRLDVFSSDAATLVATLRRSTLSDGIGKTTIANARLIAAAPDLLEALKDTWDVLDAAGLHNLSNGVQLGQTVWYVKACDAKRSAIAAIAKATGEQQ